MIKINKSIKIFVAVLLVAATVFLFGCGVPTTKEDYPMAVSFVDVGQGDGILIECEDKVVVVDGGTSENAPVFTAYLKSRGVKTIDCYIATHPHSDHIGATPDILALFDVKTFMLTAFSEMNMPTTRTYERMLTALENADCEVVIPGVDRDYAFGNLTLRFFAPLEETENYNNMSLVFKAKYGDTKFLFEGDAEKSSENLMLAENYDLSADVIKIAHHGSDSSSTAPFLNAVAPKYAVISCGENNSYGHPSQDTLALLEKYGTTLYRTDEDGTVVLYSDGKKIIE